MREVMAMFLAQTPAAPAPLFQVNNIFWLSIGLILVITFVSAMIRRLTRDKCLRLFNNYHVTFLSERRATMWGDLYVSSQGIELLFDVIYTSRRGITKSSALIYEDEYASMIALTRTVFGLTDRERAIRERQIRRTFNPNLFRRMNRTIRNLLNTLRDGITRSISLFIGTVTRTGAAGSLIASQAGDLNSLSGTVVGLAANAYEPLLERYIGKRVVIEIINPTGMVPTLFEIPGYLVDYTSKFIAVFNVSHEPLNTETVTIDPASPPPTNIPGLKLVVDADNLLISVTGDDAFTLCSSSLGTQTMDYAITLLPGASTSLPVPREVTTYRFERTRQLDLIVPRTRARIRYGGQAAHVARVNWTGIAPNLELTTLSTTAAKLFTRRRGSSEEKDKD